MIFWIKFFQDIQKSRIQVDPLQSNLDIFEFSPSTRYYIHTAFTFLSKTCLSIFRKMRKRKSPTAHHDINRNSILTTKTIYYENGLPLPTTSGRSRSTTNETATTMQPERWPPPQPPRQLKEHQHRKNNNGGIFAENGEENGRRRSMMKMTQTLDQPTMTTTGTKTRLLMTVALALIFALLLVRLISRFLHSLNLNLLDFFFHQIKNKNK